MQEIKYSHTSPLSHFWAGEKNVTMGKCDCAENREKKKRKRRENAQKILQDFVSIKIERISKCWLGLSQQRAYLGAQGEAELHRFPHVWI